MASDGAQQLGPALAQVKAEVVPDAASHTSHPAAVKPEPSAASATSETRPLAGVSATGNSPAEKPWSCYLCSKEYFGRFHTHVELDDYGYVSEPCCFDCKWTRVYSSGCDDKCVYDPNPESAYANGGNAPVLAHSVACQAHTRAARKWQECEDDTIATALEQAMVNAPEYADAGVVTSRGSLRKRGQLRQR